ncbi:MAG: thioredoxin domain-containing protein, partial [Sphingomonadales bacterium]
GFMVLALGACGDQSSANGDNTDTQAIQASSGDGFTPTADGGYAIGNPDASVKIIEFASFTCGHCASFHETVYPQLKEKYIDTGKVYFEMRPFIRNSADLYATIAINCAAPQNFEPMADLYFTSQRTWLTSSDPNAYVETMAKRAGIPSSRYEQCTNDNGQKAAALTVTKKAQEAYQVNSTPTLVVNGKVVNGRRGWWLSLDAAIQEDL